MDSNHLAVVFGERFERYGERTALRHRVAGEWREVSWRSLGDRVRAVAKALIEAGVDEGETVGIFAPNGPEWTIADLAAQQIRAVSVPIHPGSTARQAQSIVNDAEIKVIFVGGRERYEMIESFFASNPYLERLVVLDDDIATQGAATARFADFLAAGEASARDAEVAVRLARAGADDVLTLAYTPGTTGDPKGVLLTHACFSAAIGAYELRFPGLDESDVFLSYLPLSEVFERAWSFFALSRGMTLCSCEDLREVIEVAQQEKPTVVCAAPSFCEKVYAIAHERLETAPPIKKKLLRWALRVGAEDAERRSDRKAGPIGSRLIHPLADKLFLAEVRDIVGGKVKLLVCAGAPLSREVEELFHAAGIFLCNGYGLTEATGAVTCHEPFHFRIGTVGTPIPGVEVKTSESGEILVRGKTVMKGYQKMPPDVTEVFLNGWLRTGDAGAMEDGLLRVTGRIREPRAGGGHRPGS